MTDLIGVDRREMSGGSGRILNCEIIKVVCYVHVMEDDRFNTSGGSGRILDCVYYVPMDQCVPKCNGGSTHIQFRK